jgi:hypothetical protein
MITSSKFITHSPNHTEVEFHLDIKTGWYLKQPSKLPFLKLPERLKVEKTQTETPKKNGAQIIIHGGKIKGKYKFYTGLRTTEIRNSFYGNDYEIRNGRKVNSLCIFDFNDSDTIVKVYYFNGYYIYNLEQLEHFIDGFIIQQRND